MDAYLGEFDTLGDYAESLWEGADLPRPKIGDWWHPMNYVDWQRMREDLELNGVIWTAEAGGGNVWVFSNT